MTVALNPEGWAELRLWAEMYADVQSERIRIGNRIRSATVDPVPYLVHLARMEETEKVIRKDLRRCYRAVAPASVRQWQEATAGVGDHMLARLLGVIGHPRVTVIHEWTVNPAFNEEQPPSRSNPRRILVSRGEPFIRSVSQLRSYCGHGQVKPKRKGMTQDDALSLGSPRAKMLTHQIAESCVIHGIAHACQSCGHGVSTHTSQGCRADGCDCTAMDSAGPQPTTEYGALYLEMKRFYLAKEWTRLHSHNAAVRRVAKNTLRDLWRSAEL